MVGGGVRVMALTCLSAPFTLKALFVSDYLLVSVVAWWPLTLELADFSVIVSHRTWVSKESPVLYHKCSNPDWDWAEWTDDKHTHTEGLGIISSMLVLVFLLHPPQYASVFSFFPKLAKSISARKYSICFLLSVCSALVLKMPTFADMKLKTFSGCSS